MPHEPDAVTKFAFDLHPRSWLALAGLPVPPTDEGVTMVDTTMPTVSMSADKLVRVFDGVVTYLAHIEFQTSRDPTFDRRMLRYNVWAGDTYGLPVRSVAFLFRREAGAGVTGRVFDRHDDHSLLDFRYRVVRLWELPAEPLLTGPIGTLPLVVLSAADEASLPKLTGRVISRFASEVERVEAGELTYVVKVLLGLRLKSDQAEAIMSGFADLLEQSTTYQAMMRKGEARGEARGRAVGMQDTILKLGQTRFGPPSDDAVQQIRSADVPQLTRWTDRLLLADSWDGLLSD